MQKSTYPETLIPKNYETHIVDGQKIQIPIVCLRLRQWSGEPIANTFGGKGLIDYEGKAMFAELAIVKTAEAGGWKARWVETYAMKGAKPYYFSEWGDDPLPTQLQHPIEDKAPLASLKLVAEENGSSFYGC